LISASDVCCTFPSWPRNTILRSAVNGGGTRLLNNRNGVYSTSCWIYLYGRLPKSG
jgi:hypothetical protein